MKEASLVRWVNEGQDGENGIRGLQMQEAGCLDLVLGRGKEGTCPLT